MRYVLTQNLEAGMVTGRPIHTLNDEVLLREGIKLTQRFINQLETRGINGVYINDNYSAGAVVKDVIDPELRKIAKVEVKRTFEKVIREKNKYNVADTSNKNYKSNSAAEIIDKIINNLIKNENVVVNMVDIRTKDENIFSHSVNVTVLSLIVGVALKFKNDELYDLGMAAMLHDIPKAEFSDELKQKEKSGKLELIDKIRARLLLKQGYTILEKQDIPKRAKKAILEHSERIFVDEHPISKIDKEISKFAEIIGICDVYDDLVSSRSNSMLPSDAIEYIMGYSNVLFDLELVRAFMSRVAIYPIGTPVRLSTGELALVTHNYVGRTTRPTVKVVANNTILKLASKENLSITITDVYDIDQIKEMYKKAN